jgi:hypothetical protein
VPAQFHTLQGVGFLFRPPHLFGEHPGLAQVRDVHFRILFANHFSNALKTAGVARRAGGG